jgi:hypothetical protein
MEKAFFVACTFRSQPFHKGRVIQADVAFLFYARSRALLLIISAGCTGTSLRKIKSWTDYLMAQDLILGKKNDYSLINYN